MSETLAAEGLNLTDSQRCVVEVLEKHIRENRRPPTYREIADHLGWASASVAYDAMLRLEKKGVVSIDKHKSRGVQLIQRTTMNESGSDSAADNRVEFYQQRSIQLAEKCQRQGGRIEELEQKIRELCLARSAEFTDPRQESVVDIGWASISESGKMQTPFSQYLEETAWAFEEEQIGEPAEPECHAVIYVMNSNCHMGASCSWSVDESADEEALMRMVAALEKIKFEALQQIGKIEREEFAE